MAVFHWASIAKENLLQGDNSFMMVTGNGKPGKCTDLSFMYMLCNLFLHCHLGETLILKPLGHSSFQLQYWWDLGQIFNVEREVPITYAVLFCRILLAVQGFSKQGGFSVGVV